MPVQVVNGEEEALREAKTLFVTATDTGVGKTFVACAVARCLRARGRDVGVMKPVATGCLRLADGSLQSEDVTKLVEAAGTDDPTSLVNPVAYGPPLAPTAAAREAGEPLDRGRILEAFEKLRTSHEFLIVEGIGGLLVPLVALEPLDQDLSPASAGSQPPSAGMQGGLGGPERSRTVVIEPHAAEGEGGAYTVRDMAREMGAPVLIVSRDALGTINHTALTVEAARTAGLVVRGVVLNRTPGTATDLSCETNAREIEALTGVPVVARLGPLRDPEEAAGVLTDEALGAIFGGDRRFLLHG